MDIQEGIDVYSTAKSEYTQQFCVFLIPALLTYFLSLLEEAKEKETTDEKTRSCKEGRRRRRS